jgi:hypothetical protein
MAQITDNERTVDDLVKDQVVIGASDPHVHAMIVRQRTDESEGTKTSNCRFDRSSECIIKPCQQRNHRSGRLREQRIAK